jgi:hypothetical protein
MGLIQQEMVLLWSLKGDFLGLLGQARWCHRDNTKRWKTNNLCWPQWACGRWQQWKQKCVWVWFEECRRTDSSWFCWTYGPVLNTFSKSKCLISSHIPAEEDSHRLTIHFTAGNT